MTKYKTQTFSNSYNYNDFDVYGLYARTKACTYETTFDTYDEAVKSAKKVAQVRKEDVEIWAVDSIVRFPDLAYTVDKIVPTT